MSNWPLGNPFDPNRRLSKPEGSCRRCRQPAEPGKRLCTAHLADAVLRVKECRQRKRERAHRLTHPFADGHGGRRTGVLSVPS